MIHTCGTAHCPELQFFKLLIDGSVIFLPMVLICFFYLVCLIFLLSCVFKKKERPVKTMYGGHIRVVPDLVQNRLTQGQQDLMTSSCYRQCSRSPPLTVGPAGGSHIFHANVCQSGGMEMMMLTAAVPAAPIDGRGVVRKDSEDVGALEY